MALEGKYGTVTTERGNIPADEPVFLFRAQDRTLPEVLATYASICRREGSPAHHVEGVLNARRRIMEWQSEHRDRTKTPESATVRDQDLP